LSAKREVLSETLSALGRDCEAGVGEYSLYSEKPITEVAASLRTQIPLSAAARD